VVADVEVPGRAELVDPAVTTVLLERLGTAAADHDVLAAVGPAHLP
jgi:hypothetical protein